MMIKIISRFWCGAWYRAVRWQKSQRGAITLPNLGQQKTRFIAATLSFLFVRSFAGGVYGCSGPMDVALDYEQLANYEPPVVTRVHAGNGALLAE